MFTCKYCKNNLVYLCNCASQCDFSVHRATKRRKPRNEFVDEYGTIEEIDADLAVFHLEAEWSVKVNY